MIRDEMTARGFHAVGSRVLGTHDDASDWDWVATDTIQARDALRSMGFKQKKGAGAYDGENPVESVWERNDDDGQKLNVTLECDAKYKLAIMEALKACPVLRSVDRALRKSEERDSLWDTLYRLAGWKEKHAIEVFK